MAGQPVTVGGAAVLAAGRARAHARGAHACANGRGEEGVLLLRPSNGGEEVLPAVVVVHGAVVGGREAAVGAAHVRASAQLRQGVVARATLLLLTGNTTISFEVAR